MLDIVREGDQCVLHKRSKHYYRWNVSHPDEKDDLTIRNDVVSTFKFVQTYFFRLDFSSIFCYYKNKYYFLILIFKNIQNNFGLAVIVVSFASNKFLFLSIEANNIFVFPHTHTHIYILAKRWALTCLLFRSFYCANVWKLWMVFFLWNFDFD